MWYTTIHTARARNLLLYEMQGAANVDQLIRVHTVYECHRVLPGVLFLQIYMINTVLTSVI